MFNATIIVTGGTGSWGYGLVRQLLTKNPKKVIIYSRSESNQVKMERAFEDTRLSFCVGDVRDKDALLKAFEGVDYVFHLAALKHVPLCEVQPYEALKTNVAGVQNVIEAAIMKKVKKVINISSDKAADPVNFYGLTKAIGERLMLYANLRSSDIKFISVRSGNILGSSESVLQLFQNQIKEKNQITITDKRMTRYFLSMEQVVELSLLAAKEGRGGEIFTMMMPACKILDLAEVIIEASGKRDVDIVEIGIRPGEKIHEHLISEYESKNTVVFDEKYSIILPSMHFDDLKQYYSAFAPVKMKSYRSDKELLPKEEIKQMLVDGGFI